MPKSTAAATRGCAGRTAAGRCSASPGSTRPSRTTGSSRTRRSSGYGPPPGTPRASPTTPGSAPQGAPPAPRRSLPHGFAPPWPPSSASRAPTRGLPPPQSPSSIPLGPLSGAGGRGPGSPCSTEPTPPNPPCPQAWAVYKGKYHEGTDKADPSTWKTRLRCALNKSTDFQEVPERSQLDISEPYKVYQIVSDGTRDAGTAPTPAACSGSGLTPRCQPRIPRASPPGTLPPHSSSSPLLFLPAPPRCPGLFSGKALPEAVPWPPTVVRGWVCFPWGASTSPGAVPAVCGAQGFFSPLPTENDGGPQPPAGEDPQVSQPPPKNVLGGGSRAGSGAPAASLALTTASLVPRAVPRGARPRRACGAPGGPATRLRSPCSLPTRLSEVRKEPWGWWGHAGWGWGRRGSLPPRRHPASQSLGTVGMETEAGAPPRCVPKRSCPVAH